MEMVNWILEQHVKVSSIPFLYKHSYFSLGSSASVSVISAHNSYLKAVAAAPVIEPTDPRTIRDDYGYTPYMLARNMRREEVGVKLRILGQLEIMWRHISCCFVRLFHWWTLEGIYLPLRTSERMPSYCEEHLSARARTVPTPVRTSPGVQGVISRGPRQYFLI